MEEKDKVLPQQQNTFPRGEGGSLLSESEEERREAEKGSKSDTKENISDSRPHSSSVSSADSFPPGEAMGAAGNDRIEAVVRRWSQQAQQAKTFYPGLDMSRELRDPRFAHLLKCGVDVRTAFEVVHRDQILPAAMQAAARAVEKKLTAARAEARPAESAMDSPAASVVRTDVTAMSKADRADIIRRVQRGEKIRF